MSVVEISTVDSFFAYAEDLLDVCSDAVATTIGGPIVPAYVAPGLPAFDCCPQLTVNGATLGEGPTSPLGPLQPGRRTTYGRINVVGFQVTVLRCVSVAAASGVPTPTELEAAAQMVLQDVWAIWNAVYAAVQADPPLWGGRCKGVYFDQSVAIDPQGGCVGWRVPLRADLGGIPNP